MYQVVRQHIIKIFTVGFFIFQLAILYAQNTTYYISSLSGNDDNNGRSPATAWATIEKANREIQWLLPGDAMLFERGGIYYGTMNIPQRISGNDVNPITFGAYGEGEMPIISGAKQITDWEQVGNNLWIARVPERPDGIEVLFIDGKKYYPARYPNKGYRYVTNRYSSGLQDNTLNFPDGYWNGATVAFKSNDWSILRDTVAYSYNDGRINKTGGNRNSIPDPGWGYFLQNHVNAIDTIGEWAYDKIDRILTLYTTEDPNDQCVEFINNNYAFNIQYPWASGPDRYRNCYIVIENLYFQHYGIYAIFASFGKNIEIRNNIIRNCKSGIYVESFDECLITGNTISDVEFNGVRLRHGRNSRINNNAIRRVGLSLDGGQSGNNIGIGIVLSGYTPQQPNDNCEIIGNRVDTVGYIGIRFDFAQNILVKNNVVNYSLLSLSDGGGIYTWSNPEFPLLGNINVVDNIVLNTIGNSDGTPYRNRPDNLRWRHGIYLDDGSNNVTVQGNTVYNSGGGIFFHGANNNVIHGNTLYNNTIANIVTQDRNLRDEFFNNDIQYNHMYKNDGRTYFCVVINNFAKLVSNNIIEHNYISSPFSRNFAALPGRTYDRTTWSRELDFDLLSRSEPVPYALSGAESPEEFAILVYNPTPDPTIVPLDHTYISFDSVVYNGYIQLQPFKSAILFRSKDVGELLDAPVGNTSVCIGAFSTYSIAASLDLAEVDTVTWSIYPAAAGVVRSISGSKGSVITVEWLPNYRPSPAYLMYHVQMNDGSSRASRAIAIDLEQDIGRSLTPTGTTEITNISIPGFFVAENPTGAEIEWIIPPGVGTLSNYDPYGNTVEVTWGQNLLGIYPISYRVRNDCGEWRAEALPLYYSFPVATPEGPNTLCEESRTHFTTLPYTDMTSEFTWVLEPRTAGYLEFNNNNAWVTLNRGVRDVILYYRGLNNMNLPFQSPAITLTVNAPPATPARPAGLTSISWNTPSSVYTADAGWDEYDWEIIPATAGTVSVINNRATVDWAGGADHDYAGQVQINYRVKDNANVCGFSDYSPFLTVTLLPKPPEIEVLDYYCAGSDTYFTGKIYMGASRYRWSISPSNAGTVNSQTNTATISWSPYFSGRANVSYSVIDAAGRAYTSPTIQVDIQPLPGSMATAVGPSFVEWHVSSSDFSAAASAATDGQGYQWSMTPEAGTFAPYNTSPINITWNRQYVGNVDITYRAHNDCGWSHTLSTPLSVTLQPAPPTAADDSPCSNVSTAVVAPNYLNATGYSWHIMPENAGTIIENGTSTATIEWNPAFRGGKVSIGYTVSAGTASYTSPDIEVDVRPLPETPPPPTGLATLISNGESAIEYTAVAGLNDYLWEIQPAEAFVSMHKNANRLLVIWNTLYLGDVNISYKTQNDCGWSLEFSPALTVTLLPATPTVADDSPCSNVSTAVAAPNYVNATGYIWRIMPENAGTIIENGSHTATIEWNPAFRGGKVSIGYTVSAGTTSYESLDIEVDVRPLPETPPPPTGTITLIPDGNAAIYTAAAAMNDYLWDITPAEAFVSMQKNENMLFVTWNENYVGKADISYKTQNACGWSLEFSPALTVTLLPAMPIIEQSLVCAGSENIINAPFYQNAASYQWTITPSSAGQIIANGHQATIHWNAAHTGEARISYTITNSAQESYLSPNAFFSVIDVPPKPSIASGAEMVFLNRPNETYRATSVGIRYEWTVMPSHAAEIQSHASEASIVWNPAYLGEAEISYRVMNECGWSEMSDPLAVQVYKSDSFDDIPDIFTPNGDGINDTWDIPAMLLNPESVIRIYNRAKQLIVEFRGSQMPWDGRDRNGYPVESGYYLYQIDLRKGGQIISGYVTILR